MKKLAYVKNMKAWRAEFNFFVPIKIRFSETDMFGHVNNVSPFIYFEEGRIEFLKAIGLFSGVNDSVESIPVVADLQCDYHQQLYFNDTIDLYIKVNELGISSYDVHYLALNEHSDVCLTGRGRMVQVDATTGKPTPLSNETKEKLIKA